MIRYSKFRRFDGAGPWWAGTVCFVALIVALPVVSIIWLAIAPAENIWPHLVATSLPRYLKNTVVLMAGVGTAVFLTGVVTAYLVGSYEFPFRKQLEVLLLLPLAIPAYVIAYLYTDLLEFAGPVQAALRTVFGWELARDYWFPNIRSLGGAVLMMGLVLYPYVYLMARSSFLEQSPHLRDVSRLMGRSQIRTFLFVSLPVARPAIAIGVALALMETINDFGTVDFFSVHTLSAGLFDVWLNMNNLGGAAQIALVMLSFVPILVMLEYLGRKRARFYQGSGRFRHVERQPLHGAAKWFVVLVCLAPVLFGFIIPAVMLIHHSIGYFDRSWTPAFRGYAYNSILVSTIAATVCCIVAIAVCYARRLHEGKILTILSRLSCLGYAVPGAVLAVGIVIPLGWFDNALDALMEKSLGISTGLMLSGTIFSLVLAYVIRFLAISMGSVNSSFSKISTSIDMAARTLGHPPYRAFRLFQLPLLKSGILTALLIVFVDCMKELPATLLLRPFNFETLATHVYLIASDEQIEQAALGSLCIVLAGILPVIVLTRAISYSQTLAHSQTETRT